MSENTQHVADDQDRPKTTIFKTAKRVAQSTNRRPTVLTDDFFNIVVPGFYWAVANRASRSFRAERHNRATGQNPFSGELGYGELPCHLDDTTSGTCPLCPN